MEITHKFENNSESQTILEENRKRLNKVCLKVHNFLSSGGRLSALNFTAEIGAIEYRKRFDDLKNAGYPIRSKHIRNGMKEWFYENTAN